MNTGVRVKRFLDVDSDSDLEDSRHSNGASPKTLSFRTETASKQVAAAPAPAAAPRKGSFASNTSSIVFESDIEVDSKSPREVQSSKASKAPSIDVAPKSTPAAAAAAPAKPSATAAAPQPNPKSHTAAPPAHNTTAKAPVAAATAKSGAAAFAFPTKAHTTPAPAPAVKTAKSPAPIKPVRLPLDEESLSEVEPVVKSNIPTNATTTNTTTMVATPTTNGATAALHTPVSQTASSLGNATNVEELLQRAKTRLEDRGSAAPTPRSSCRGTPQRRDSFVRSSIERPSAQQEARVRRLIQENARLQDEVRFLHGDNQRLKALNNTAPTESVESVRHTLTIDMLKKELHSKELEHERRVTNIKAESDGLRRQTNELIEQCEGYASSAAQYKQLYNDKLKELEKLKTQFQALMSDLNNIDRKQEAAEEQHNKQLAAERDRSQRLEMTLADAKRQRTHLQELNNQLQTEVAAAIDGRKKASGAAVEAEERGRAERAELERQLTAQRAEIDKFRALLQDREQNQGVQLREAERQRREVQDRLQSLMADAKAEKQRLSKALDDAKEDSRRVLREEVERRLKVEDALRKVETERRTSIAAPPKALVAKPSAEVEQRLTAVRKELSEEQSRRRAAEQEAERQSMEVDRWKQASEYYQNECDSSTQNISHAEVLREKAEQQCNVLRATLNQMIEKDEGQSLRLHELEMALEEARRAPQHPHTDSGDVVEDIHQLSDENERLTMECTRLATERDALTEENAIIAAELLRWKKEVQQFVSSQGSASPPTKR